MGSLSEIQISEAQLEDFFMRSCHERLDLKPISRQVRLDSGIVDVFCRWTPGVYYVVELKVEPLQPKHLAQVLGYSCELRGRFPDKIIRSMLIGPSLADGHLTNCLKWFEQTKHAPNEDRPSPSVCDYRLYSFDALEGINYFGYSPQQRDIECRWAERTEERIDQLQRSERSKALEKIERNIRVWRCL